jgi:hypothetical protein
VPGRSSSSRKKISATHAPGRSTGSSAPATPASASESTSATPITHGSSTSHGHPSRKPIARTSTLQRRRSAPSPPLRLSPAIESWRANPPPCIRPVVGYSPWPCCRCRRRRGSLPGAVIATALYTCRSSGLPASHRHPTENRAYCSHRSRCKCTST